MDPAYLSVEDAKSRYAALGQPPLPDEALTAILLDVEALIDDWLNWRPAPTEYTQVITSSRYGRVMLPHQPILSVRSIKSAPTERFPDGEAVPGERIAACWTPGTSEVLTPWIRCHVEVIWTAGYDPIPRSFGVAAWNLLRRTLELGEFGNLALLSDPAKHMTMLSLPGGLSKQYAQPSSQVLASQSSILDQILQPVLERYRRRIVV